VIDTMRVSNHGSQSNSGLDAQSRRRSEASPLSTLTHRNVEIVAELEKAADRKRNKTDVIADVISGFVGSMSFVYLHLAWFAVWIGWNSLLLEQWHFDPYPFTFLTFVVSLEAIFLSTFILISQNHEELLARRRNHLDLQINLLSEQENSQIIKMLASIEHHLKITRDPEGERLEETMKPEELASQIDEVIETNGCASGKKN
jgi:uncharacterized membrane protein